MHPILFQLASFTVYSYGFFIAIALLTAFGLSARRASAFGFSKTEVADVIFVLFISGIAGARLFFIVQHYEDYVDNFWKIFSLQEGGLVWYGGFLAALLAGAFYARSKKWSLLKGFDFFSPVLALAQAIGRMGCFFNGCCFGKQLASGIRIPTQLLEAIFLLLLSTFLFFRSTKKNQDGQIFFEYLILYSAARFLLEFLRGDQIPLFYLTIPQWTSLFLFIGGAGLVIARRKKV